MRSVRAVGFVGVKVDLDDPVLVGAFVYVAYKDTGYVVTAAHVYEGVRSRTQDAAVHLRVNLAGRGSIWIAVPLLNSVTHSDPGVDLVACQAGFDPGLFDARNWPMTQVATTDVVARERIGLGDEVFLTGLFEKHYGVNRNRPIIRMGAIAAMPEEPVPWTRLSIDGNERVSMRAYLVEARSIGGLSGSPVVVHLGMARGGVIRIGGRGATFYLLGIMHGHWDAPIDEPVPTAVTDEMRLERVNMGIAIVTPVDELVQLLEHRRFADARAQRDAGQHSTAWRQVEWLRDGQSR